MKRVDSGVIKSLAAYIDSDEDDDASLSDMGEENENTDPAEYRGSAITGQPTQSTNNAYLQTTEPAASDEKSQPPTHGGYDSDDENSHRQISSLSDFDEADRSPQLKEPPPPPRRQMFHSPSPAASANSTPRKERRDLRHAKILPSTRSLVSYQAEDDEEGNRLSLEGDNGPTESDRKQFEELLSEISKQNVEAPAGSDSDRSQQTLKSEEMTDDIDIEAMLEKPVESSALVITTLNDPWSLDDIQIPPPPASKCSDELQERFANYIKLRHLKKRDFNAEIQNLKDFRNPSIYEKLTQHYGIDEIGSNFAKEVFDSHEFKPRDFYDELAKAQRGATKDKPKVAPVIVGDGVEEKKRKSKWDNPNSTSATGTPLGAVTEASGSQPNSLRSASGAVTSKTVVSKTEVRLRTGAKRPNL